MAKMLKRVCLLLLLFPMLAFPQGSRKDDVATKNLVTGLAAAPGALITVCTSAGVGVPCTPLANIYSDVGLTSLATNGSAANAVSCSIGPTTNPCLADSNGNYGFYASPGRYVVTVTGAGTTGKSVVYTLACDPSAACTVSGTTTLASANGQFFVDGVKYSGCPAAITAAGTYASGTSVTIPGTGPIINCPATDTTENIIRWNYDKTRDWCNGDAGNALPPCNAINFNYDDGNVYAIERHEMTTNHQDANGATLGLYTLTHLKNATANGTSGLDGFSGESNTEGTLSGTFNFVQAHEADAAIKSTGGTITDVRGGVFYANIPNSGATAVTNLTGVYGLGCNIINAGSKPTNCYGAQFADQTSGGVGKASGRNYSFISRGRSIFGYSGGLASGGFDCEDAANLIANPRCFEIASDSSVNLNAINATGINLSNAAHAVQLNIQTGRAFFSAYPVPVSAAFVSSGIAGLPWSSLFIGTGATSYFNFLPGATAAARTVNIADPTVTTSLPLFGGIGAGHMQTKRVAGCATAASLNATCDTTITWTTAFADANYTAVCTGDVVTSGVPIVQGIDISAAKTGAAITVRTISITAAAAQFATIDCNAQHD